MYRNLTLGFLGFFIRPSSFFYFFRVAMLCRAKQEPMESSYATAVNKTLKASYLIRLKYHHHHHHRRTRHHHQFRLFADTATTDGSYENFRSRDHCITLID